MSKFIEKSTIENDLKSKHAINFDYKKITNELILLGGLRGINKQYYEAAKILERKIAL